MVATVLGILRRASVQPGVRRAAAALGGAAGAAGLSTALAAQHCRLGWQSVQCEAAPATFLKPTFIADAAEKVAPALVNIEITDGRRRVSNGSGFVIDAGGLVLTNNHVVSSALLGDNRVMVRLSDGTTTLPGVVQHSDPASDIAIVRVEPRAPLPTVPLGSSEKLRPGEFVVALGAPAGLSNSVSAGIVSAVHRKRSEIGLRERRGQRGTGIDYIQTDAAINSGNSGGPLCNLDGEVIGINTMKVAGADGIAFAIPIDEVKRVTSQLSRHGRLLRPYLGIKLVELSPQLADELNRRNGGGGGGAHVPASGLHVMHVHPGSPAHRAGVRVGDTIVGGAEAADVGSTKQLIDLLSDSIGKTIPLRVIRDGRDASVKVLVESVQQ